MDQAHVYRRLPGRAFGLLWSHALWRTDDHLLAVHALPGGESYRRFYFRDIQAIVVRPTRARLWINFGAFMGLGFMLLPLLFVLGDAPEAAWFSVGALLPLGIVLGNTARGPTCEVRVQTAVQFERIPALSRVVVAERVLRFLAPEILAAQQAAAAAAAAATVVETPASAGPQPVENFPPIPSAEAPPSSP